MGGARAWLPVAALAFGGFAVSLVHTLVVPLLPLLPGLLHASAAEVSWLVTATLLASAIATPLLGRLGDQFGKRRMLLVALALLVAGSVLCALTGDLTTMIVGRALQGCATAVIPLGISIIGTTLPPERRPAGIALVSATLGIGGAIGLPASGLVVGHADFRLLFWACAAAGVLAAVAVLTLVPAPPGGGGRVDVPGAVLLAVVLCALMLPLANGGTWGWTSARTLGLGALFAVSSVLFVRYQLLRHSPLVDIRAVRRRPILLTNVVSVLVGFALYVNFLSTATYVEAPFETGYGFGVSAVVGGLCMLPGGITMLVLSPVSARLISRRGARLTLIYGSAVIAAGFLLRMVLTERLWQVLLGATVASAGAAVAYAAMPAMILDVSAEHEAAAATSLNTLARGIGTSLASASATALLATVTVVVGGTVFPAREAFLVFFAAGAVTAALAVFIATAGLNPAR
ncbi:MFS transporter [Phytohabitans sp. ZYX-F-186]|uniref:MFS transporter n=1 Tax=Phytohabitans maris TaxID=3071409 RepID=A0ABU0ZNF1_9ACTN|nr:MFS transporter [Phytohabitans sp. ZYX-F-186]MDQ7908565.1 MFS transporter [Phytohabitans sp. ZYX-F-186]